MRHLSFYRWFKINITVARALWGITVLFGVKPQIALDYSAASIMELLEKFPQP